MARRSRRTPPSTRRCPMSGWRHVRRSWTPRLPSGSLPLRPLIARKTRSTVRTSRATRCRSGSPTRQDGPKIRAAKAELEAEARAAAEAKAKAEAEAEEKRKTEGRKKPGKPAAPPSPEPAPKAQKNFTDLESRIRAGLQCSGRRRRSGADHRGAGCHTERCRLRPAAAHDRRRGEKSGKEARASVGRLRILLGGQPRGLGEPSHRRLRGDRPSQGCCQR